MIWHPLTWTFWTAAITGTVLYSVGAWKAATVILGWDATSSNMDQLRKEHTRELAMLLAHWAVGCLTVAASLGLGAMVWYWHQMIPGAMCGTGVLQAMGTDGNRAMIFWGILITILHCWRVVAQLGSRQPEGIRTPFPERVFLSTLPLLALALFFTWKSVMGVEAVPSVSCCAAVYDQVLAGEKANFVRHGLTPLAQWFHLGIGGGIIVMATLLFRFPCNGAMFLFPAVAIPWSFAAGFFVQQVWSAYYYQVLSHPCPWCLFLLDYHGAGFFIFGSLVVIVLESAAVGVVMHTAVRHPELRHPAVARILKAALRVGIALIGFMLLTAGPAVAWRLTHGVWLNG